MVKFFKKFSFWDKIRLFLGTIGIGSQFAMWVAESYPELKVIVAFATVMAIVITFFFKDENHNDIVDAFESK